MGGKQGNGRAKGEPKSVRNSSVIKDTCSTGSVIQIKANPVHVLVSPWRVLKLEGINAGKAGLQEGTNLLTNGPTHPSQQRLSLSHVVNEAQGPGGAVEASMQAVIQV